MNLNTIYEDKDVLVIDKPAGVIVFPEGESFKEKETLIRFLLDQFPYLKEAGKSPRYGIVHRLDKDTSGILLVAKNNKNLDYLQGLFKERKVIKKYTVLLEGSLNRDKGRIQSLIGRDPKDRRKQKVYSKLGPDAKGKREAITEFRILKKFSDKEGRKYTLAEAIIKTGRRHQIRTHFRSLDCPVAGDKLYGFKNQIFPPKLRRQFLHADYIKLKLQNGLEKEFKSELSEDLKETLRNLNEITS
jgi:23S rRNA pseudouridine1911/1915/1917 synthase